MQTCCDGGIYNRSLHDYSTVATVTPSTGRTVGHPRTDRVYTGAAVASKEHPSAALVSIEDEGTLPPIQIPVVRSPKQPSSSVPVPTSQPRLRRIQADQSLDLVLLHRDFPGLVNLAAQVKKIRAEITAGDSVGGDGNNPVPNVIQMNRPKSHLRPDETMEAVFRMQKQLLSDPSYSKSTIQPGAYPMTDMILEDMTKVLQNELNFLEDWKRNKGVDKSNGEWVTPKGKRRRASSSSASASSSIARKESIAIKYSKWQTDILMNWMIEHKNQPFPDQAAIDWLMHETGLSQTQVVNWTTNVRKRNRKATCEGGKKPHHFIDFLFLAQDREERQQQQKQQQRQQQYPSVPEDFNFVSCASPSEVPRITLAAGSRKYPPSLWASKLSEPVSMGIFDTFDDTPIELEACDSDFADKILIEFSHIWLNDCNDTAAEEESAFIQLGNLEGIVEANYPYSPYGANHYDLLSTVTDEVRYDTSEPPFKLPRRLSFDVSSVDDDDEDMQAWAKEFGLTIEV